MILESYAYKYALVPHAELRKMGLGWRKSDENGMSIMNLAELKQLPGEGAVEEKVEALGGHMMNPDEAYYYRHTNTFSFAAPAAPETPSPEGQQPPVEEPEETDPGFSQGGMQTEFPPLTEDDEDTDPGFSQEQPPQEGQGEEGQGQEKPAQEEEKQEEEKPVQKEEGREEPAQAGEEQPAEDRASDASSGTVEKPNSKELNK